MSNTRWLVLITSLPGQQRSRRMRVWRALKASGAGIVRDGVNVLPHSEVAEQGFQALANDIEEAGGSACLLTVPALDATTERHWMALFDRGQDYEQWAAEVSGFVAGLKTLGEAEARRAEGRLRRAFEAIAGIDFFPADSRADAQLVLSDLSSTVNREFSPDEPASQPGTIEERARGDFSGRVWATRQGIWVDRIASAWLIRRFIDPQAQFLWLEHPRACPDDAVGFDFDGASFTHVGEQVTFEVLLVTFGLNDQPPLRKLAALVHYADVGGLPVDDAAGFITMLAGIKQESANDDALLDAASVLLDHLYAAYCEPGG